jgi:hypothetical protein
VEKGPEQWTLVLVRELHHPPERVWEALTEPEHLREWAPFDTNGTLDKVGATVKVTWAGTGRATVATVVRLEAPRVLEFGDVRWELEPMGKGTRLTLWHAIDRGYIAWGAAGWHICFDVLDWLLTGAPLGRIAGADAMQFEWKRLVAEYGEQFEAGAREGTSKAPENS